MCIYIYKGCKISFEYKQKKTSDVPIRPAATLARLAPENQKTNPCFSFHLPPYEIIDLVRFEFSFFSSRTKVASYTSFIRSANLTHINGRSLLESEHPAPVVSRSAI